MSDPITWKPVGPARFKFVHELGERVSDADIAQRSLKLKTDCSVAMDKIDRATQASRASRDSQVRLERRSAGVIVDGEMVPVEYRSGGRILSVQ